jgi:hypothetical protein
MKKYLLLSALCLSFLSQAQVYNRDAVNLQKKQNKLTGKERYVNPTGGTTNFKISPHNSVASSSGACDCWIPRDTSFTFVPFDGSGGSGGPGMPPNYANDDWSTNKITLPFHLCLYGASYDTIYINNNGNVSMDAPYSVFTAVPFPSNQYVMIAPFWGDVDTRGLGSGYVYYKLTPTSLIIQWDSVGYYNSYVDKLSTFQLIITNGADSILPIGKNVSFCYKDMQWTTGDASGGIGGFGGTPATVGVNKGDGVNFAQVGLFDQTGTAYDGSVGSNDGVDWLDNRNIMFDACGTIATVPPIAIDSICDTTMVFLTQTVNANLRFLSGNPTFTTTINASGPSGFSVIGSRAGNLASIQCQFTGSTSNIGYNTVTYTASDNDGAGSNVTVLKKVFNVLGTTGVNVANENKSVTVFPNPATSKITVDLGKYTQAKIIVKTMIGQNVMQKELNSQNNSFDISAFENGTYLMEIHLNDKIIKKLFIKE